MTRGGKREGAGRRSAWNYPKTTLIRVPEVFVDRVLAFARELDNSEEPSTGSDVAPAEVNSSTHQLSLLGEETTPSVLCPKCSSAEVWKEGKLKTPRRRYKCQVCSHIFSL